MASSSNSPCAACKFLRRKCQPECVFAPYFPPDQPQKFANVHKVFGASNVTKLLNELHPHQREDAVNSLAYEADMRLRDPVYGCVGVISLLQHQLRQLQVDLSCARTELSKYQSFAFPTPATTCSGGGGGGVGGVGGGVLSAMASTAAATATSTHHHHNLGISLLGIGGGGRDNHHQNHLYSHHQFFPSNHQTGGGGLGINTLRGFDMAAGGSGTHGYDGGGLLAMNMNVSAAASIGQLGQLHQQPTARAAGGDDRRSIDPS
ncbi:protein ASYMMETRIC LEAVES 2 [Spinacia oleracea]|uniref:Protein ASYMMETRIC LEAVES 2 n=1 Tax=Spinacia oleracea TaxID=3562 RepID=A0A9R0JLV8_SPIOL|nr:protein ASYMMETRIC LEAVES 2 [Spinacia oleracea]XP_056682699.1 protein ASYMMETRIC LEAVES 2 [Spinacia oleracea]XP_056682700.1 protein ASYMMETRIC LEAVES 2 [Spinacia oleracea]